MMTCAHPCAQLLYTIQQEQFWQSSLLSFRQSSLLSSKITFGDKWHKYFTCQMSLLLLHTHTHSHFTALWTLSGTTRVSRYQKVHFTIFWIFWSKMKITQADAPTIWMDCHPIQTNWCHPLLPSPPFLCRMPFLTQPSQFILAWDRHQICWLAYPVAWLCPSC